MTNYINVNRFSTFLVQFDRWSGSYICISTELMNVLKNESNGHAVLSIKRWDTEKHRFSRISKKEILQIVATNAETQIYFENHPFFKR